MKAHVTKLMIAIGLLTLSAGSQAVTVFSDNFDANAGALNAVPATWTVKGGTVDIIPTPDGSWNFIPESGLFIDLDGSTGMSGLLSHGLTLNAGTQYTATFDLAGSHRGSTETVAVNFGGVSDSYTLLSGDGWTHMSLTFTPTNTGTYELSFQNTGGDNVGMLLDNVSVQAVPEPETYAMLLSGLGLIGFIATRRKINS